MSQFRLINNVPDVYVSESRDFQLLLRLYDSIFGGLKYDIDTMQYITDTKNIRNVLLPLLATKLGFFSDLELDDRSLRLILEALPYFLQYKGALEGVKEVINLYLKIMNETGSVLISYSSEAVGNLLDHTILFGSDIEFTNLALLDTLLDLVLPVGFNKYFYYFESLDVAETAISQTDEILLLGKIISTTSSILRNSDESYIFYPEDSGIDGVWLDSDTDIYLPSRGSIEDAIILKNAKDMLIGSASIMQLAGSSDTILEYSNLNPYRVGDVVYRLISDKKIYYQCLENLSPGQWNSSKWLQLKYYIGDSDGSGSTYAIVGEAEVGSAVVGDEGR